MEAVPSQVPIDPSEPGKGAPPPASHDSDSDETFQARYCALVGCPESDFERRLFFETLKPFPRFLARVATLLSKGAYEQDLAILRRFGPYRRLSLIVQDAADMRFEYRRMRDFKGFRRWLGLRISGQRLSAIAAKAFGAKPAA